MSGVQPEYIMRQRMDKEPVVHKCKVVIFPDIKAAM